MKLYEMDMDKILGLQLHPDFASQRPNPVGIMGSGVYKFHGTNIYSWYVNKRNASWESYGDPVYLTPAAVKKFLKNKEAQKGGKNV